MILKITWKRALTAAGALSAVSLAIAWSGVINIGASTGHWAITDWFLHWAMRNSVRTQAALTVDEPAIDQTNLVSAAGHYAATCALCHGAPGKPPLPVMQASTPAPPDLAETVNTWSDQQLFWIIKHGVKFTPMPAWPALGRDDEIRRMAAFVRRLPDMTAEEYREFAYGSEHIADGGPLQFKETLSDCQRCHADNGRGQGDIPVLAGQKPEYLLAALNAFASGIRASGVMSMAAARIDPAIMRALADHYASLPGLSDDRMEAANEDPIPNIAAITAAVDPATADKWAAQIVRNGLPEVNLPACSSCHAPGKRPHYPILAGQKPEYLAGRLRQWRGDDNIVDARKSNATMPVIARRIPEHLIEPLARYIAAQGQQ